MRITRRAFARTALVTLSAAQITAASGRVSAVDGSSSEVVVLEAIYAASLPAQIKFSGIAIDQALREGAQIFERRVYQNPSRSMVEIFQRYGIRPLLEVTPDDGSYLIPFVSLVSRQRAWDRLNGDRDWKELRAEVQLTELSMYRVCPQTPGA